MTRDTMHTAGWSCLLTFLLLVAGCGDSKSDSPDHFFLPRFAPYATIDDADVRDCRDQITEQKQAHS